MSEPSAQTKWTVIAHPLFLDQLEALIAQVSVLKQKDPEGFTKKNATKRLAAIAKLAFEVIPHDPTKAEYRQGDTLGEDYKHWFRAKFFQQYRLFFRYHAQSRLIVLAWVNDEDTKRAYGRSDDAYRVFSQMLVKGKRSVIYALSPTRELRDACVHVEQRGHMRCRGTQRY